jgi:hypothetical protein
MLKEKTPDNTQVIAVKLITGEEIIARKLSDDDNHLIVSRPLAMVMAENPENPQQTRVMFTPWMVSAGKEVITIKNAHVVAVSPAREDAAEQYEQAIMS